jgi:cyanate lyase
VGDVRLPEPGPGSRLRWDLNQLHATLNEQRQERGLAWAELAQTLGRTPSRLTNPGTARMADMDLTMRITQRLNKPAAEFIHPTSW